MKWSAPDAERDFYGIPLEHLLEIEATPERSDV